ncbi:GlxA family transcriptional regulator [Paracoccus laeviglucosivorans]|uniref:Transcriptional regulator, AraC family with amidase-like domain n=1 Tax=Paracoccus laeviglucosivorans TaxID=1197861 RepID=A0A521F901_9RHOB|nr:GlxA family transcriptional regulator [Paracoccus laeviglucosivorans]SMO92524.1 transcriptional regulator, AraC family with amidase-like domain [Paracoccus laeviglucosivorans]
MNEPLRIGFILTADYALMSLGSAVEPLRAANHLAGRELYRPSYYSVAGGFAASTSGGGFQTQPLAQAGPLDLALIVAGGNPMRYDDPGLARGLRGLQARKVAMGGISGGAAILARLGLIEGRRFTLHWAHIEALAEAYPDLLIERALYVIDRDRYTCAGGVAALDMMCAIIARDHGAEFSRAVADWFIHPRPRTADEPQRSPVAERFDLRHPMLVQAVDLMFSHLADPLSPEQIAAQVGCSPRQLQRLFGDQLGRSMMQFYREMRLQKADELVQQSGLSMLDVAQVTGFVSAAHFSRLYGERFGMAPGKRRQAARRKGQSGQIPGEVGAPSSKRDR